MLSWEPKNELANLFEPEEFTDWALSREALEWLGEFVVAQGVRSIVECGSGLSTILFGAMVREGRLDHVLSLEHDERWFDYCQFQLRQKSLIQYVDLQLCPLHQTLAQGYLVNLKCTEEFSIITPDSILYGKIPHNP